MSKLIRLSTPLTPDVARFLHIGDKVLLSGIIYGARDAAHKRFADTLARGEALPVDFRGQIIYYVGPTPAKPGQVIGSAGPTTGGRMDAYTPALLERGLAGAIGKGGRSPAVMQALREHGAVYFAATGGAGALLSRCIKSYEVVDYADLGPEALVRLDVEDFPLTVVADAHGGDLYVEGKKQYAIHE